MVNYGMVLEKAIKFSIQPKRWLPIFILDVVFLLIALGSAFVNISSMARIMAGNGGSMSMPPSIVSTIAVLAVMFAVWMLIRLFISGSIIHQASKPRDRIGNSCTVARQRFLSLLAVAIIIGVISGIVGVIPYIGWIVSIIISLMFFFSMPIVIVGKKSFDMALKESYNIFRKKPFEVFLAWLLITIISMVILFVFAIPMIAAAWSAFVPMITGMSSGTGVSGTLSTLMANGWMLLPAGLVLLIGIAFITVFGLTAQTYFYGELKKRRLL
jgi:hypothetical protein